MNRKEFYARRRVYRIMLGQDNDEYSHYPSKDSGKYWSGMQQYDQTNPHAWDYIGSAKAMFAMLKYRMMRGQVAKESYMAEAPARFKARHPKVKLP